MKTQTYAFFAAASMAVALTACGDGGKTYDISPIFPLSSDKCAKYNGDEQGSGITATCMVTEDECEKAAADWQGAMQSGGVDGARFPQAPQRSSSPASSMAPTPCSPAPAISGTAWTWPPLRRCAPASSLATATARRGASLASSEPGGLAPKAGFALRSSFRIATGWPAPWKAATQTRLSAQAKKSSCGPA
jgi:hypothetical protein